MTYVTNSWQATLLFMCQLKQPHTLESAVCLLLGLSSPDPSMLTNSWLAKVLKAGELDNFSHNSTENCVNCSSFVGQLFVYFCTQLTWPMQCKQTADSKLIERFRNVSALGLFTEAILILFQMSAESFFSCWALAAVCLL